MTIGAARRHHPGMPANWDPELAALVAAAKAACEATDTYLESDEEEIDRAALALTHAELEEALKPYES